jgi:transposase
MESFSCPRCGQVDSADREDLELAMQGVWVCPACGYEIGTGFESIE